MLSYEDFRQEFCFKFPEVMGAGYEDYELKLMPVVKRGRSLDGFTFCPRQKQEGTTMMPTYYFNDIYESYCADPDIDRELWDVAESMKVALAKGQTIVPTINLANIRKGVIAELVNPDIASNYLFDVPHRFYLNLCIIYRWVVNIDESGIYSGIIDNSLMNAVDIDEDELYECAIKNTKKIIVPQIKPFDTVVRKLLRAEGRSDYEIRKVLGKIEKDKRIYVLTNKRNFRASTAIIYPEVLKAIAEKTESNYYIVPTSVNESLLVPVNAGLRPTDLIHMLKQSNWEYFNGDECMLSDSVYYYNAEDHSLDIFDNREVTL